MASLEDTFVGLPVWAKALALVGVLALLSAGYYAVVYSSISTELTASRQQKQQLQDQIRDAERREVVLGWPRAFPFPEELHAALAPSPADSSVGALTSPARL